jgi:hypothetical protein
MRPVRVGIGRCIAIASNGGTVESFKKRQKEMRRLERQRDKAAKRKELKERKAAGIAAPPDDITETPGDDVASPTKASLPPTN